MTQPRSAQSAPPLIPILLLFGGLTLILMALFTANPGRKPEELAAFRPTHVTEEPTLPSTPTEVADVINASTVLDPAKVAAGEIIFQGLCVACHGFNAMGITGLGKPLIGSQFVDGLTDEEFLNFLHVGRDVTDPLNTTGVTMPAKGGNPNLTDDDLLNVIAYIRSLNAPAGTQIAAAPTTVSGPTPTPYVFVPLPLTSSDSSGSTVETEPTAQPTRMFRTIGEALYVQNCVGCHAVDGSGVPNLASSLASSQLVSDHDGMGLVLFLTNAQPPVNPEIGFPHPYRGGYPQLTDEQLRAIIAYIYSLDL